MVENPATARHATRGYDDARVAHGIQLDGFIHRTNEFRIAVDRLTLAGAQLVLFMVFAKNLCGLYGHGTVEEYRQFGNAPFFHDLVDHIEQHLGTANRKSRYQYNAATASSAGGEHARKRIPEYARQG